MPTKGEYTGIYIYIGGFDTRCEVNAQNRCRQSQRNVSLAHLKLVLGSFTDGQLA
jgi:hypothetical protein